MTKPRNRDGSRAASLRLQAAIAAREQANFMPPLPGSRACVPADLIWPADRIGPQLHIGASRLSPFQFRKIRMDGGGHNYRLKNEAFGGLYTSTLTDGPEGLTSAFAALVREADNNRSPRGRLWVMGVTWWRLEPDPAASILVMESPEAFTRIAYLYPYGGGTEIDFEGIARDGFVGVHLTAAAAAAAEAERHEGLWGWQEAEQTCWLSWAFIGKPERLAPPAWVIAARERERDIMRGVAPECAGAPRPKPGTQRYWLSGAFVGQWFDARPLSARGRESARAALGRADTGVTENVFLGAWATQLEDMIVAHNFEGPDGEPLSFGDGAMEWFPKALLSATESAYTLGNRLHRNAR